MEIIHKFIYLLIYIYFNYFVWKNWSKKFKKISSKIKSKSILICNFLFSKIRNTYFQIVGQKLVNLTPQKAKGTCKLRRRSILTEGNGIQRRGCVSFMRCKNRWCNSSFQKYGYNIVFERKLGGPNCNYIYSDLTECIKLTAGVHLGFEK